MSRLVDRLELRVPPPVVALITAAAMWGTSGFVPSIDHAPAVRTAVAVMIAAIGVGFDVAAIVSFLRARTTVNPMNPGKTSSLVVTGVYEITRNPMYLGLLFILIAWAVVLSSAWLLAGPLGFALYMTRFQIQPEEQALRAAFGSDYVEYKTRVRRWL